MIPSQKEAVQRWYAFDPQSFHHARRYGPGGIVGGLPDVADHVHVVHHRPDTTCLPSNQDGDIVMVKRCEPEEIVTAALYLASDASGFTTGSVIRVDGGAP